jgi:hypothetical protein
VASWSDVRKIALAFPGASEIKRPSDGHTHWIVNRKLFVWERPLRKADLEALGPKAPKGPILGVRTADLEMKEVLLKSDPSVFFTTPHFDGYPAVLVRLDKIGVKKLRETVEEAWLARAGQRAVAEYLRER